MRMETAVAIPTNSAVDQTQSFDDVYAEHQSALYRYCCRLCGGNVPDAEDLAQETWVLAYRHLGDFRGEASVKTWLYTIAYRRWIRMRKEAREAVSLDRVEHEMTTGDPHAQRELQWWLNEAIARLPEVQRTAFILVKVEGLSHREAAEVLEAPQGTIQFRVHQAMLRLRKELAAIGAFLGGLTPAQLERAAREWQQVSPPDDFTLRVYQAIAAAGAEAGTVPAAPRPSARGGGRGAPKRRNAAGVAALVVVAGAAGVLLLGRRGTPNPPPEVTALLEAARRVRAVHATGVSESLFGGNGSPEVRSTQPLEYWFKAPGRYRQEVQPSRSQKVRSEQIIDGGRGIVRLYLPGRPPVEREMDTRAATRELSRFALFSGESALVRALRERGAAADMRSVELGSVPVRMIEITTNGLGEVGRWTCYVDPRTHLPVRMEYTVFGARGVRAKPRRRLVLDTIRYDIPLPDALFDVRTKPQGARLTEGPRDSGSGPSR